MSLVGWNALCFVTVIRLQRRGGERHENLSTGDADWRAPDGDSLYVRAGSAVGNASAVTNFRATFPRDSRSIRVLPMAIPPSPPKNPAPVCWAPLTHY